MSSGGDADIVDDTGKFEEQIKKSFENAAGAFKCDVDQCTINLIAIDVDNKANRDLCNAIFGTELIVFRGNIRSWRRKKDGFFNSPQFSQKVAGVIIMKRKEKKPVSDYSLMLFLNDNFKNRLNDLNNIFLFDKVIYSNMRPVA